NLWCFMLLRWDMIMLPLNVSLCHFPITCGDFALARIKTTLLPILIALLSTALDTLHRPGLQHTTNGNSLIRIRIQHLEQQPLDGRPTNNIHHLEQRSAGREGRIADNAIRVVMKPLIPACFELGIEFVLCLGGGPWRTFEAHGKIDDSATPHI